jgi:amidase
LIAGGQVSAAEVLEAAIERAERWQPAINAITIPLYEQARAAARTGLPAGPLSGVRFLLKDLGAQLTGTRTSGSGKLWGISSPTTTAALSPRYRAAGLNIFGKVGVAGDGVGTIDRTGDEWPVPQSMEPRLQCRGIFR